MRQGSHRVVVAVALVAGLLCALRAAFATPRPAGDFLRYQRAATLAWRGDADLLYDEAAVREHRAFGDPRRWPEMRYRYSPALAVALSPLGALRPDRAWIAWSFLCGALTAGGAATAAALAMARLPAGGRWWIPAAAAVVPLLALYSENVKLGQMNCAAFGLTMAALAAVARGRDRTAGLAVAGAAVAKHLPGALALWFLWNGRRRAAAWSAGAMVAVGYLLPTAVLGPERHHRLLGQWIDQEAHLVAAAGGDAGSDGSRGGDGGDADGDGEVESGEDSVPARTGRPRAEGQSLKALLYRGLTPTPFFHLKGRIDRPAEGPDGRRAPSSAGPASRGIAVHVAELDPDLVHALWIAACLAVVAALLAATGPGPGPGGAEGAASRLPLEAGLFLGALLLVSPESRNPHFQMLAPLLAGLAAGHVAARARGAPAGRAWIAVAAAGALLVLLPTKGLVGRAAADHMLARGSIGIGALLVYLAGLRAAFAERRADAAAVSREA